MFLFFCILKYIYICISQVYKDRNYTLEYQGREQHNLSKHPIEPLKLKINDRHSDR